MEGHAFLVRVLRRYGQRRAGWDYGSAGLTGTVTEETVEFSFPVQEGNRITYTGTIQDRTISGTCDYGPVGGPGTWEATRQQSTWDFSLTTP